MANEILPPDLPIVPRPTNRGLLLRLFAWGCAASLALAAAAFISQTQAGGKRLRTALGFGSEPEQAVAVLPPHTGDSSAESQRLMAQVRELTADRDRLNARIAVLERNLADVTGSIKRQGEQIAAVRAAPPAPVTPATILAPPAPAELPFFVSMRMPQAAEPPQPPQQAEGEAVPLPPVRVAAISVHAPGGGSPARGEFAIDLGGAATIEALRAHWAGLKANYGPLLAGLQPRVTEHPKQPSGVTYRLLAGPLPNAEEAARLCARFPAMRTGCHPTRFSGELVVR